MYKKQLLKIGHSKKSRMASAVILSLVLTGLFTGSVFANNHADTPYSYRTGPNGFATETREKTDYSSSYIHHQGTEPAKVQVKSNGINYNADVEFYYVNVGQWRYLPNYVKENGQNNCYLYLTPSSGSSCTLFGVWSPDSV